MDRIHTVRQDMISLLSQGPKTVRDISQSVGLMEKDVVAHLTFVEKTLKHQGKRLCSEPYRCLSCGFVFKSRKKFSKPGKCPECRRGHIETAHFWIE